MSYADRIQHGYYAAYLILSRPHPRSLWRRRVTWDAHRVAKEIALRLGGPSKVAGSAAAFSALVDLVLAQEFTRGPRGWDMRDWGLVSDAVAAAAKAMPAADPDTGHAHLVVTGRQIGWAGLDGVRADEYARNVGGVLVRVPIVADYRPAGEGDRR